MVDLVPQVRFIGRCALVLSTNGPGDLVRRAALSDIPGILFVSTNWPGDRVRHAAFSDLLGIRCARCATFGVPRSSES